MYTFIYFKSRIFFGGLIVNLILQKKLNNIYLIKYCQRKVEEKTRVHRNVAKFTKIYKNKYGALKIDNFEDKQMKKWVIKINIIYNIFKEIYLIINYIKH